MATSAVKRKVKAFRILTCLMGLTKMFIYRQSYFRPDMALAQKMWDEWDEGPKGLDRGFGLPKPTPRKNIKRMENCVTMCVLDAVAEVFFYKQTAHKFKCSQLDADGKCKPFDIKDLWEVITILQPTPEIIHEAWSMGLEYSIGTSAIGFNATTALGDCFEYNLADYLRKPYLGRVSEKLMSAQEVQNSAIRAQPAPEKSTDGATGDKDAGRQPSRPSRPRASTTSSYVPPNATDANQLPELSPRFGGSTATTDNISDKEVERITKQLRTQREQRSSYRHHCSRTNIGGQMMHDAGKMVDEVLGPATQLAEPQPIELELDMSEKDDNNGPQNEGRNPTSTSEYDDLDDEEAEGRRLWQTNPGEPPSPSNKAVYSAFYRARALDSIVPTETATESAPKEKQPIPNAGPPTMSLWQSAMFPTQVEASIHYKPQVLIQWCCGESAFIDTSCMNTHTATRKGGRWQYKERGLAQGGSKRWDQAWKVLKDTDTWFKLACMTHGGSGKTCAQFDFHVDGLKDCFYLMSTRDNSRRVCEEPLCSNAIGPERAYWDSADGCNNLVTATSVLFKMQTFQATDVHTGKKDWVDSVTFESQARHPDSGVPDCEFQRKLDARFRAGKLPALNVLVSNRVTNSPPIRFNGADLEVSVSALDDHYSLLAEAVIACSQLEGLKNQQEVFCHGQPGPDGLSSPFVGLRKRVLAQENDDVHTLPYSYDILPIFISKSMGEMLYDDYAENHVTATIANLPNLGLSTTFEDLPHVSLRYIGFGEANRQTISLPRQKKRPKDQAYVEAGDPTEKETTVSLAHVSRSIGRHATEKDLREHISRKQGARAMLGVRGDIFAYSTWLTHAATSLENRGLLEGSKNGTAYACLVNKGTCLSARVVELASQKNMGTYGAMKLKVATPGTYQAVAKQKPLTPNTPPERATKKTRRDIFAPVAVRAMGYTLPGITDNQNANKNDKSVDKTGDIQIEGLPTDTRHR